MSASRLFENPMENVLVVANICKYLDHDDLKLSRNLNRMWKAESDKFYWKSCPPIILHKDYFKRKNEHSIKDLSIPQYMRLYAGLQKSFPNASMIRQCKSFRVTELESSKNVEVFFKFLSRVGPHISSLELVDTAICNNAQELYDVLGCKFTTNLESLVLKNIKHTVERRRNTHTEKLPTKQPYDVQKNNEFRQKKLCRLAFYSDFTIERIFPHYQMDWLHLLTKYPNLKTFEADGLMREDFQDIAAAINTLRLGLVNLKWHSREQDSDREVWVFSWRQTIEHLEAAKLPLKLLDLQNYFIENDETTISFLESLKNTLESLIYSTTHTLHSVPQLKSLKTLALTVLGTNQLDLRFLSKVPNLKSLTLRFIQSWIVRQFFCLSNLTFPTDFNYTLSSQRIFECDMFKQWNIAELKQVCVWMPHITKLSIALDNETLSWVCENMPQLKHLEILGDKVSNSGILGGETTIETTTTTTTLISSQASAVGHLGHRHGVSNLKELENLFLSKYSSLTEKSVLFGFANMPRLTCLKFGASSELSLPAQITLATRIQSVTVYCNDDEYFL